MDVKLLISELTYKVVRSSGSGGQHVNKVSSKVELYFNLNASQVFDEKQKERLKAFLKNRTNKEGIFILTCDESRSQFRNKALVTQRFLNIIENGLKEVKERRPTKIPRAAVKKRLSQKRKLSEKKANRKPPSED